MAGYGFVPVKHALGGQILTNAYTFTVGSGTAMFKGDVLKLVNDGTVATAAANDGLACIGVCAGIVYTDASGIVHYADNMPADTTGYTNVKIYVWDDPYIVYRVATETTLASTDVNQTADHVANAGSATTHLSGQTLDCTNLGSKAQFFIIGNYDTPGNDWGDTNQSVLVRFNEHAAKAAVAGV